LPQSTPTNNADTSLTLSPISVISSNEKKYNHVGAHGGLGGRSPDTSQLMQ